MTIISTRKKEKCEKEKSVSGTNVQITKQVAETTQSTLPDTLD
jgi:hypothetical protein